MDQSLVSRLFDRGMIEQAFPLVSTRIPGMTLDRWTRFALSHAGSRAGDWPRGLMAVQNPAGYILGMFAFEVREHLHEGRVLCVENVIVPNLPGRDMIWGVVVSEIEHLATMNGCRAVFSDLPCERDSDDGDDTAWVTPVLERSGYMLTSGRAFKRVRNRTV
jgi:hypothetical protein